MNITIEQLVLLAKEAEVNNPIEWGELPIQEDLVYATFAKLVHDAYQRTDPSTILLVLMASVVKLKVEMFVLEQINKKLLNTIRTLQNG